MPNRERRVRRRAPVSAGTVAAGPVGPGPDLLVSLAILACFLGAYYALRRLWPGVPAVSPELSGAIRWFRRNAEGARVLAWWDYAQPLVDHADVVPVVRGPAESMRHLVDDPHRVREWDDPETVARVARFLLAETPREAVAHIGEDEFDYLLVSRADLLKLPAMRAAATGGRRPPAGGPSQDVVLHALVEGDVDWDAVYRNGRVRIYRVE